MTLTRSRSKALVQECIVVQRDVVLKLKSIWAQRAAWALSVHKNDVIKVENSSLKQLITHTNHTKAAMERATLKAQQRQLEAEDAIREAQKAAEAQVAATNRTLA